MQFGPEVHGHSPQPALPAGATEARPAPVPRSCPAGPARRWLVRRAAPGGRVPWWLGGWRTSGALVTGRGRTAASGGPPSRSRRTPGWRRCLSSARLQPGQLRPRGIPAWCLEVRARLLVRRPTPRCEAPGTPSLRRECADRGDRLRPRDRGLAAAEPADQPVVPGLQPAPDPDRGPGGLDQHRLDVGPGIPGPAVLALARADVARRAQRDPRRPASRAWRSAGARPGRSRPARLRHHVPAPRHGDEQARLPLPAPDLAGIRPSRPSTASSNTSIRSWCRRHCGA